MYAMERLVGLEFTSGATTVETIIFPVNRGSAIKDAILLACQRRRISVSFSRDGINKRFVLKGDGEKVRKIFEVAQERSRHLKKSFKEMGYKPNREGYTKALLREILSEVCT